MKIEKSCDSSPKLPRKVSEIPTGTTFRYGDLTCGPYLKVNQGFVDLRANYYARDIDTPLISNYVELPNAKLVTGE